MDAEVDYFSGVDHPINSSSASSSVSSTSTSSSLLSDNASHDSDTSSSSHGTYDPAPTATPAPTTTTTRIATSTSPECQHGGDGGRWVTARGYHADDDSVVSLLVPPDGGCDNLCDDDPELALSSLPPPPPPPTNYVPLLLPTTSLLPPTVPAAAPDTLSTTIQPQSTKKSLSRRDCCVWSFVGAVLIAASMALILGYTVLNTDGDTTPFESNIDNSTTDRGIGGGDSVILDGGEGDSGGGGSNDDNGDLELEKPPPPGDFGAAMEYYTSIRNEISDPPSFVGDRGDGSRISAQQQAIDFLVVVDVLPMAIADENGEDVGPMKDDIVVVVGLGGGGGGGRDEPIAPSKLSRPYLGTDTPIDRVVQRYATVVLYYATNGTYWDTDDLWIEPGVHECDWVGVTCEDVAIPAITLEEALDNGDTEDASVQTTTTERMVVAIDLPENNVRGYLPQEVVGLPYLRRLGLWSNGIRGSLPSQLGNLMRLRSLLLDDNLLTGTIPSQLGMLEELTDLSLGMNIDIAGRIPNQLGTLRNLKRLNLAGMSLHGTIPTSLRLLTNLIELTLMGNRLGRTLPEEMGDLLHLESLILSDNEFTGSLPKLWSNLIHLKQLEIQINDMHFDVDESICTLRNGSLDILVMDCQGNDPKVTCSCCTSCF